MFPNDTPNVLYAQRCSESRPIMRSIHIGKINIYFNIFHLFTNHISYNRQMCTNILISVSTQSMASLPFTTQAASYQPLDSHQQLPYHPMSSHDLLMHQRPSNSIPVQPMSSRQMPFHTILSQPLSSQPFDSTITSSIPDMGMSRFTVSEDTSRYFPPAPFKRCFICNTTSSESFESLCQTTSMHSETKIYDFVWQFLDNQPSVRNNSTDAANSNWSLVCAGNHTDELITIKKIAS